jgi:hypothetical protein
VAEQVVVQEVQVAAGQPLDLGQHLVHGSGVERLTTLVEGVLVAELAVVRAATGTTRELGQR